MQVEFLHKKITDSAFKSKVIYACKIFQNLYKHLSSFVMLACLNIAGKVTKKYSFKFQIFVLVREASEKCTHASRAQTTSHALTVTYFNKDVQEELCSIHRSEIATGHGMLQNAQT